MTRHSLVILGALWIVALVKFLILWHLTDGFTDW